MRLMTSPPNQNSHPLSEDPASEPADSSISAEVIDISSGSDSMDSDGSPFKPSLPDQGSPSERNLRPRKKPTSSAGKQKSSASTRLSPTIKNKTPASACASPRAKAKVAQAIRTSPRRAANKPGPSKVVLPQHIPPEGIYNKNVPPLSSGSVSAKTRTLFELLPPNMNDEDVLPVRPWFVVSKGRNVGVYSELKKANQAIGPGLHGRIEVIPTRAEAYEFFTNAYMNGTLEKFYLGKYSKTGALISPDFF